MPLLHWSVSDFVVSDTLPFDNTLFEMVDTTNPVDEPVVSS